VSRSLGSSSDKTYAAIEHYYWDIFWDMQMEKRLVINLFIKIPTNCAKDEIVPHAIFHPATFTDPFHLSLYLLQDLAE